MKIVKKPWGEERWFAEVNGKYMGKVLIIEPGEQVSYHYHKEKEEHFLVWEGTVEVTFGIHTSYFKEEENTRLHGPGEVIHISPMTGHTMKAYTYRVVLFEVSTYHPDDSVRVKDFYNRKED